LAAAAVIAALVLAGCSGSHHAASSLPSAPISSASQTAAAASASAIVASPVVSTPPVPSRPPDDKPGPVILVPGYGGSDSMLAALAVHLEKAGRTAIVLALPDNAEGDLRVQAGILAQRVVQAIAAGARSVDLVGYSAGGVVIGLVVASQPQFVRRVVTIGSPLHGTEVAGLAVTLNLPSSVCGVACRQMAPGTSLLASLNAAEPAVTGVPWTSMWTTDDQVVLPPDSARFAGATNIVLQQICADDNANHLNLTADPLVIGLTLSALDTSQAASPSASDCTSLRALGAS
jgi:triacylglycerol lipase